MGRFICMKYFKNGATLKPNKVNDAWSIFAFVTNNNTLNFPIGTLATES